MYKRNGVIAMRKTLLLTILILALPVGTFAAAAPGAQPHWSLEFKGGLFYPDIDTWKNNYGSDRTWNYAGSLAYMLFRQVEVGLEGGYIKDKGQGNGAISGMATGSVVYELFPVQTFVLVRGVFSERQWLVPYAGGGWTRMYYQEKVEGQAKIRGSADGYHGRAGLQLLLDNMDLRAASNLHTDYGIFHSYLFFEAQYIRAMINDVSGSSINLGGNSYFVGLRFEL